MASRWLGVSGIGTLLLTVCASVHAQTPMGTAFTYQGRLKEAGGPVTGAYDILFTLYDAEYGGSVVGPPTQAEDWPVNEGLFTIPLDFGSAAFGGDARWLKIAVRPGASTGSFTTLNPRQPLTAAPYALYALNAPGGADWNLTGNAGTDPNTNFVGTSDDVPLVLRAAGRRALRIEPTGPDGHDCLSANVVAGCHMNSVAPGTYGATIAGGGMWCPDPRDQPRPNVVTDWFGTVGGGCNNQAGGTDGPTGAFFATVGGGSINGASAYGATVSGGLSNIASGWYATVAGGQNNRATNYFATAGGGSGNIADNSGATVGGGGSNWASGTGATIAGGSSNTASGENATIAGGAMNTAGGAASTIGGGTNNTASEGSSTVSGGGYNEATGYGATVGGGEVNTAGGAQSTIAGGFTNSTGGSGSTVGGGRENNASAACSTVGGGILSTASGEGSTIAGGVENSVGGYASAIGGGYTNAGTADYATVGGGRTNTASGFGSTVPGGAMNKAGGHYSLAAGFRASVREPNDVGSGDTNGDEGTFTWADASDPNTPFSSTGPNQFLIRAGGGVGINTNDPTGYALNVVGNATKSAGGEHWAVPSDARLKQNIAPLCGALERLLQLQGRTFEFRPEVKSAPAGQQIGFVAQEVECVFPEWVSEDAHGYKCLSVRGGDALLVEALRELRQEKDAQIAAQREQLAAQQRAIEGLQDSNRSMEQRLAALEKLMLTAGAERKEGEQ